MMHHDLSDAQLSQLSTVVATQMGLHFPRARWGDLARGIGAAAREFGFDDTASCLRWLMSSPLTASQIATLASHLTVGETYFFREPQSFAALKERILPELIRARRSSDQRLSIWSAGCCTGEEPYSIAILLSQMIADLQDWHITIFATDIHPHFLQKAAEGVYREWSFRNCPRWIKERYFKSTQTGHLAILPHLQKMVSFALLNLADDTYPALMNNTNAMDIVLCRNVLMYFAPERAKQVLQNLYRALVAGGWLIVSPNEALHTPSPFEVVNFPGVTFYRKPKGGKTARGDTAIRNMEAWEINCAASSSGEVADAPYSAAEEQPQSGASPRTPDQKTIPSYEESGSKQAAEQLGARLSQNPADAQALECMARLHANQGQLTVALGWCEKAVAVDRLNPAYYYLLATILQELGQAELAVHSLKRTLYLDQHFVLAHVALGTLTRRQGRSKESRKHFANALALLSDHGENEILPESEGITAGRLRDIIQSMGG